MEDFHERTLKQQSAVLVRKNGVSDDTGKVICVEGHWTFSEFLRIASERLDLFPRAIRAFNMDGAEVDDCMMISETDTLFLSCGESFIPPSTFPMSSLASNNAESTKEYRGVPSSIGIYGVGVVLGCGAFGEVRLGINKFNGEKVALKFLKKSEIQSMGAAERTSTEIQCLTSLDHRNIIRLHTRLEIHRYVVLVFDFMEGGDMFQYLKSRGPLAADAALPEEDARRVFQQVINGVDYAHKHHIIHKDLKLENLLLKDASLETIKIADFGLSQFCRPGVSIKSDGSGTLSTAAPEILSMKGCNAGPPLDIWSLGVVLFALLCGRLPFEGPSLSGDQPTEMQIRKNITRCRFTIDDRVSSEAKDLLRRILKFDPLDRATMAQIMQHSWLKMKKQSFQDLEGQFHFIFQSIQDENPVANANHLNDVNTESGDNISPMRTEREKGSKRISVTTEGFSPKGTSSDTFFKSTSSLSNRTKSPRRTSLSALDDFTDELDKSISDHYLEATFSASHSNSPVPSRRIIDADVLRSTFSGEHSSDFGYILSNDSTSPCEFNSSPRFEIKGWGVSRSRDTNDNKNSVYEKTFQQKTISRNKSSDAFILANLEKFDDDERTYLRTRIGTEDRSKCGGRFSSSSSSFTSRQSLSQGTTVNSSSSTSSHTTNNNSLRSVQSSQSALADEIDKRLHDLEKSKEIGMEKVLSTSDSPHISPKRG